MRHPVGGSEGDDDLAAAVAAVGPGAGKPHQRPAAQPPQLPLAQGDIRSQHRDDGAFILVGRDAVIQQGVDRRARHDEVIEQRMVGEHQCAHGVGFSVQFHHPGGGADAAFQAVAAHPPPGTYGTLGKICLAVCQRGKNVLLGHMEPPDIVQAAVVALADHRVHAAGGLADVGVFLQHILYQRGLCRAHAEGVGKQDGRFQRAQLVDLHKAGGLAKAVDDIAGRQHFFVENIPLVRQQRRYARLHHAVCQGAVPYRHPRHIADLIPCTFGQRAHLKAPFVPCNAHRSSSLPFSMDIIAFPLPKVNHCNKPGRAQKKAAAQLSHCAAALCFLRRSAVFIRNASPDGKAP